MKLIDKNKWKNSWKSILCMLFVLILILGLEYFLTPNERENSSLGEEDIQINAFVINEIMSSNKGSYTDEDGNSYDWIELYNGTDYDIDLSGYGLSDEESGHTKWIFPSYVLKSKEYVIVYLSGQTKTGLYANFALNKSGGETITLKKKNGKVVDAVKTVSLDKNVVMARDEYGNWITTT